jgi:hypothetical protein
MRNSSRLILLFFVTILLFATLSAQKKEGATITGRLSDSENGIPLENAIVFLSNTPYGTSTGIDGRFLLSNVAPGEYELTVSRVGYERQTFSLNVTAADTFFFDIKLKPVPVRINGVEVETVRPEEIQPKLFFPKPSDGFYCIYGRVNKPPIGILFTDSAFYMCALSPVIIDSSKYIELWLLYKNLSKTPYDLNPLQCLRLRVKGKALTNQEILPSSPGLIIPAIDTQEVRTAISESFGSTLEILATKQSAFEWEKSYVDLQGRIGFGPRVWVPKPEKLPPAREGSLSATLYSIFQSSVNVGIMKRYTIFPGNSVNGYTYFPFPGLHWKATSTWLVEASEYEYEVEISTPSGIKRIIFSPH